MPPPTKMIRDYVKDFNLVEKYVNDIILEPDITYAKAIAFFLVYCLKFSSAKCYKLLNADKEFTKKCLDKLISNRTDFYSSQPVPLIEIVSFINADKMQEALNVKRKEKITVSQKFNGIIPNIKTDMLYKNDKFIWIRFYLYKNKKDDFNNSIYLNNNETKIIKINNNVFEIYFEVQNKIGSCAYKALSDYTITNFIDFIDENKLGYIIFCSELSLFQYNFFLFLSNFIKFHFCYANQLDSFNPQTDEHYKSINTYTLHGIIFSSTKNANKMKTITHPPLISITGERPSDGINSAFQTNKKFDIVGARSMMCINNNSDYGTVSHFEEFSTILDTSYFKKKQNIPK